MEELLAQYSPYVTYVVGSAAITYAVVRSTKGAVKRWVDPDWLWRYLLPLLCGVGLGEATVAILCGDAKSAVEGVAAIDVRVACIVGAVFSSLLVALLKRKVKVSEEQAVERYRTTQELEQQDDAGTGN